MPNRNKPADTFTAELASDGESWHVIHRKWRPKRHKHSPRQAPVERIYKTFHGPSAKTEAFAMASRLLAKSGKGAPLGRIVHTSRKPYSS